VLRAFGKQCILSKHFGCKERHFFKHVGYESKAFCAKLSKHGISWMRIKGISSNVSDVHQGFAQHCGFESRHFFENFGCESTHFVQTLWMKSKEFIQTSWMRIRSIWCNRFECTARLCSNSLDAKEGLLKKKKQKQGICSNMLVRINTFVRTCWL
jgi:hypothetical protein